MIKIYPIIIVSLLLCSCNKEKRSKEVFIKSQLAYPMSIEEVIKKIGQPDSVTSENHDYGSFGEGKISIYHYGKHHLIFSSHGIYMGEKTMK